jgi:hypothetical protein
MQTTGDLIRLLGYVDDIAATLQSVKEQEMSPKSRAKIAATQRARWAKVQHVTESLGH